jgi:hypothetical protein
LNALLGFREEGRWNSKTHKPIPGADQRGVEQERGLKIQEGIVFAALRLVNVSTIIIRKGVDGVQFDGCRVVIDRASEVA